MKTPRFRVAHLRDRSGEPAHSHYVVATAANGKEYPVTKVTRSEQKAKRWCKRLREAADVHTTVNTATKSLVGQHKMWLGLDRRGRTQAVWWKGCKHSLRSWKSAVAGLGYTPVKATVAFPDA